MTKPRASRVGPYEILALIGVGGMGEVYRARDSRLEREVAIKFLPDDLTADADRRARFEREARTLATLNHPNIAAIYGLEESTDGTRGLVLELVEGRTLTELVARGPDATPEALSIAKQIADALAAAHEVGVVHRDLKPQNIKVRADGSVKVLDFGLAKKVARDAQPGNDLTSVPAATSGGMTRAGSVLGTPAYMSPEQTRGHEVDQRSDVWAFGCVVFETLTGRRAFEGDDAPDIVAAVLRGEPDWSRLPADLPSAVEMLLRRCLEKDPARRLRSIGDVRFLIEDSVSRSIPPAARAPSLPPSAPPSPPPSAQRRAAGIGAVIVLAGALVATIAIVLRPDDVPPATGETPAATAPQSRPTAAAPAARAERLIAVLPFDTLSAGPDDAPFVAGLHMEVLNQIGKLRSLSVISRSSVLPYAEREARPAIAKVAADLGVSAVMETAVVYAGNQLRVNTELIEAGTERQLWSASFRAERGNVDELFAIQTEIATAIATALGAEITAEDRRRVDRVPTESIAAYQSYLRALDYSAKGIFVDAVRELDATIAQDPSFAEAYAHRAYIYAYAQITSASRSQFMYGAAFRETDFQRLTLADAERALELYDGAGVAWLARALTHSFHLRFRAAEDAYAQALAAAPNDASVLQEYAVFRLFRGDVQAAQATIERAIQVDPNAALTSVYAAWVFSTVGRTNDASAVIDKALVMAPDNISVNLFAGALAADATSAERFAEKMVRLAPEQGVWALMTAAEVYRRFGMQSEADAALDRFAELAGTQGVGDVDWALYYLARGDGDAAYARLEKAVEGYENGRADPGFIPLQQVLGQAATASPDSPLAEPRFQRLFDRIEAVMRQ